jgi:hypothetical protein
MEGGSFDYNHSQEKGHIENGEFSSLIAAEARKDDGFESTYLMHVI